MTVPGELAAETAAKPFGLPEVRRALRTRRDGDQPPGRQARCAQQFIDARLRTRRGGDWEAHLARVEAGRAHERQDCGPPRWRKCRYSDCACAAQLSESIRHPHAHFAPAIHCEGHVAELARYRREVVRQVDPHVEAARAHVPQQARSAWRTCQMSSVLIDPEVVDHVRCRPARRPPPACPCGPAR